MKISVSVTDIKLGLKTVASNTKCPVARAILRAGLKGVSVGVDKARTQQGEIELPDNAVVAISHMCNTDTMKPFTFSLTKKQINILTGN